jgi:hypothetical protein
VLLFISFILLLKRKVQPILDGACLPPLQIDLVASLPF